MFRAPSTWPAANSSGKRTSMMPASPTLRSPIDRPTLVGADRAVERPSRLAHAHSDHDARSEGERGDQPHRGGKTERIGSDGREKCADGVAEITPEPVHAHRRGAPRGVCDVADGREQSRVDHRRADAEQEPRRPRNPRSSTRSPPPRCRRLESTCRCSQQGIGVQGDAR